MFQPFSIQLLTPLYAAFPLVVFVTVKFAIASWLQRCKMPPGPTGIPILGNALQMPTAMPWFRFTQWKEEYGVSMVGHQMSGISHVFKLGPVFSLNLAGQRVVVLNTYKAAADLFGESSGLV
jgi:hypothetical protein